jgi:hypothetical protein
MTVETETLFQFINPHRQATWPSSHAGSPVSVSLVETEANEGFWSTVQRKGVLPWLGLLGSSCQYKILFSSLHLFSLYRSQ